jgi:hypothetical protein
MSSSSLHPFSRFSGESYDRIIRKLKKEGLF